MINICVTEPVLVVNVMEGDVDELYQSLSPPATRDDGPLAAPGHGAVTVPAR